MRKHTHILMNILIHTNKYTYILMNILIHTNKYTYIHAHTLAKVVDTHRCTI